MKRNRKGVMPEITRETYKRVKKFDRQQFMQFCSDLYEYGFEDGMKSIPDIDAALIIKYVSAIKGIGSKKLEDIRAAVENAIKNGQAEEGK